MQLKWNCLGIVVVKVN